MSDNGCECEYCSNQGELSGCWALQKIAALEAKVAANSASHNTGSPKFCLNFLERERCAWFPSSGYCGTKPCVSASAKLRASA